MNNGSLKSNEWYIPLSMAVTVAGGVLAVNQILSPLLTGIVDINIKLTRLEAQQERIHNLEERTDRLEKDFYKKGK